MKALLSIHDANKLIRSGRPLFIAGDSAALERLERGTWIAGTIPYFMGAEGGVVSVDQVQVTPLPRVITSLKIVEYDTSSLSKIPNDYFANGFSFIVIPGLSTAHLEFAKNSFSYPNLLAGNLVGWISGNHLGDPASPPPHVVNGLTLQKHFDKALVIHAELPAGYTARTEIVNIFEQGDGDRIVFPETSFETRTCLVNGRERAFADYLKENAIDVRVPMVADYSGARINVSIKYVSDSTVSFYAPVYAGTEYRLARPVHDYQGAFEKRARKDEQDTAFACNCILNFLYANLKGRLSGPIGPFTFGEIAYILLNQTSVYLFVEKVDRSE